MDGFTYFLEYAESDSVDVQRLMEYDYDPYDYTIDYEGGTLITYTDMEPATLEGYIYDEVGAYAINYGRV